MINTKFVRLKMKEVVFPNLLDRIDYEKTKIINRHAGDANCRQRLCPG